MNTQNVPTNTHTSPLSLVTLYRVYVVATCEKYADPNLVYCWKTPGWSSGLLQVASEDCVCYYDLSSLPMYLVLTIYLKNIEGSFNVSLASPIFIGC